MIQKFATVEQILEVKSSNQRLAYAYDEAPASGFSKFAAMQDGVREEDGYLYVRARAISSRVNKNNDGWPSEELASAYSTFEARPIFVDHNNSNPKRTRGVIVDSTLHVEDADKVSALDPYYASAPENHKPPTWIELLMEVDAKTYPKLGENIRSGKIDAVSMGANIDKSVCSVCANEAATPSEYCDHIKQKGLTFEITSENGDKVKKKAYEDCYGVNFFEISFVFDPADPTADVLSKKGSYNLDSLEDKASEAGVNIDEVKAYLLNKGVPVLNLDTDYEDSSYLASMVGKTLPTSHVAALKQAQPDIDQFMAPKGTEPQREKNRNFIPQSEMVTAPEHVDTLRNDQRCPVCHASEMETGADGILTCPICGHVQEPEPLNNPDLELARDNDLRQQVQDPNAQATDQTTTPVDPLDSIEFNTQPVQTANINKNTSEGISRMFTTKLRTTSKEEADKILPVKVGRVEAKVGHGIHRGIYDAAREAGLKVKVAYPGVKSSTDNSVEVPGDNGIFNLFFAEESSANLGVPMAEVPITIEAATQEDADKFAKILAETPLPRRRGNDKKPITRKSQPSDEPATATVISDQQKPVEAALKQALELDGFVELDGKKYRLDLVTDEPKEESKEEDSVEVPKDVKDESEESVEEKSEELVEASEDDREAKLLAAFKLADMAVGMSLITQENKMAYIAELEEESLAEINAREETLKSVKSAGLIRHATTSPLQGVKRIPRLSHAVPSVNGSGSTDDIPLEALFL